MHFATRILVLYTAWISSANCNEYHCKSMVQAGTYTEGLYSHGTNSFCRAWISCAHVFL